MEVKESISVVVQGQIDALNTPLCLQAIRSNLPSAEIILSTWENSDLTDLTFDKVAFSKDPGAVVVDEVVGTLNNVNRQLVTTKAGLAAATRPYILKTRTDILIENGDFLKYYEKYSAVPSEYLQNRLLICNYYTRNPRIFRTCFHPSDWILFGRAEDVRAYYDSPLQAEEDSLWFKNHNKESTFFTNYVSRFTPEQHIFLSFLRRCEPVNCDCYYHRNKALIEQTERAFAECFIVLDYQKQLNIAFPKYNPNRYLEKHTLLHYWQWRALYSHYCLNRSGVQWAAYRLHSSFWNWLAHLRTLSVRLLDKIGIKEKVKSILSKNLKSHP